MQVWGNHLKNKQTQSKWLGCKTWWACVIFPWFGVQAVVLFITVLYLSLMEVRGGFVDPQNHTFEKIRSNVLTLLKNQRSSCKRKIFARVLQLLFSLYELFILPKIPFKIVLKIVEMPLNVEYPTLPLNENAIILTAFLGWKYPKSSNKRQRYLIILWLHANYLFYMKIHVKCK